MTTTTDFRPLTAERARQIRDMLRESSTNDRAVVLEKDTGRVVGTSELSHLNQDRVNAIAKFDRHYA
jgi:hypothetical protein